MKKILTLLTCFSLSYTTFAQQDAQYTQYMFNPLSYNPAYAGSRDAVSLMGLYRYQWAGIEGAPRNINIGVHSPLATNMGAGLYLENDVIGIHNTFNVYASYAYHIPVSNKSKLSLGLQAGIQNYTADWSKIDPSDIDDPTDPSISDGGQLGVQKKLSPNFGLGAYYYGERYFIGAAVPHLLKGTLDNLQQLSQREQHYFVSGAYVFSLTNQLDLKPTLLLKAANRSPLEADINLSLLINKAIWIGAGYQTTDGMAFNTAYQFKNGLRIGYAYDLTLSKLANYSSGSHEIMLGWDIKRAGNDSNDENLLSPRFF